MLSVVMSITLQATMAGTGALINELNDWQELANMDLKSLIEHLGKSLSILVDFCNHPQAVEAPDLNTKPDLFIEKMALTLDKNTHEIMDNTKELIKKFERLFPHLRHEIDHRHDKRSHEERETHKREKPIDGVVFQNPLAHELERQGFFKEKLSPPGEMSAAAHSASFRD